MQFETGSDKKLEVVADYDGVMKLAIYHALRADQNVRGVNMTIPEDLREQKADFEFRTKVASVHARTALALVAVATEMRETSRK